MQIPLQLDKNIYVITTPYKDISTKVFLIRTGEGSMLFDTASYPEDITDGVIPMLSELGVEDLRAVFISHRHKDHAGGLSELLKYYGGLTVYSLNEGLKQDLPEARVVSFCDGEMLFGGLTAITLPGHTEDSAALLETGTGTLITGDCLQLYGIFGSGLWGANVRLVGEHLAALDKLRSMTEVKNIYTAHDYHPYGNAYLGREAVLAAIDACAAPLYEVKELVLSNPNLSDEQVADLYNSKADRPTLGAHVVTAVRKTI